MNNTWLSEDEAIRQRKVSTASDPEQMVSWESENRTDRISMRIEPSLKEAFSKSLPPYASISDIIREYMIDVAKGGRPR